MGAIPSNHSKCTVIIGTYGTPVEVLFVGIIDNKVVLAWPNQTTIGYEPADVTFL